MTSKIDMQQVMQALESVRGAPVLTSNQCADLAQALNATAPEAPRQETDTKRSAGDAFRALTEKDWQLILEKATNSQLSTLVKSYKKIIGRYQHLCGELYQVLGALDAPAHVLDRVSDASESMVVSNTPSLLPFDQHAWPSARAAECQDPAAIVHHTKTDISERFEGGNSGLRHPIGSCCGRN
jgi:hypothetical protein